MQAHIKIEGRSTTDLVLALKEVLGKIEGDNTSGEDSNTTGRYKFVVFEEQGSADYLACQDASGNDIYLSESEIEHIVEQWNASQDDDVQLEDVMEDLDKLSDMIEELQSEEAYGFELPEIKPTDYETYVITGGFEFEDGGADHETMYINALTKEQAVRFFAETFVRSKGSPMGATVHLKVTKVDFVSSLIVCATPSGCFKQIHIKEFE